jgi:hypothetical protein
MEADVQFEPRAALPFHAGLGFGARRAAGEFRTRLEAWLEVRPVQSLERSAPLWAPGVIRQVNSSHSSAGWLQPG